VRNRAELLKLTSGLTEWAVGCRPVALNASLTYCKTRRDEESRLITSRYARKVEMTRNVETNYCCFLYNSLQQSPEVIFTIEDNLE
jgi:hypothetical protein